GFVVSNLESSIPVNTALIEQLAFLPVPAGTVNLGLDEKIAARFINSYGDVWREFFGREMPQHPVNLDSFDLARYPVTNGIYAQFIAAQGYHNSDYWTPDGWSWRQKTGRLQPNFWDIPRFAGDDRPVVGVSWFEATALARWASIATAMSIRLPTEAEWEWAARGTGSHSLYPWGGAWDITKLNSGESDAEHPTRGMTTAVGMFSPAGDGPFGHADLLGQVWEWTSSILRPYPYNAHDGREDLYTPEYRVLRGGNWSDGKYANRVTTRYLYPPTYGDISTGVRLAACGTRPAIAPRTRYDLVVYGRTTFCSDLIKTKKWLDAWNVPYRQLSVDTDEQAASRLDRWLGTRTIPTLIVAERNATDPIADPADANLADLRNADRGSMLHEPEEGTLRAFLIRNGFLTE
ncbi:MAG: SUMF1/EgtB/PvdO family nonheme iron enzyme, partial [Chloroflexota bacterium]